MTLEKSKVKRVLSAAGPLALISDALGWQQVFIILGVITLVLATLAWMITHGNLMAQIEFYDIMKRFK
jgi:hypothetical protein